MPKLKRQVPKYRLHKASGQAVVTVNSRDIYLGVHDSFESHAEYDRVIAEWKTTGRVAGPNESPAGTTVDELILMYLDYAAVYYVKNGEPTSTQQHIRNALKPLHRFYGNEAADDIGPLRLKALRQHLIDQDRWCRNQINKTIGIIRRMFKWGVESELVAPESYHRLAAVAGLRRGRTNARETEPIKPVADALVDAILPHVSEQVAAMINLQRITGMRPGEVVMMRAGDLDTSRKVWEYTPETHKTEHHGRPRKIYVGPKAQKIIAQSGSASSITRFVATDLGDSSVVEVTVATSNGSAMDARDPVDDGSAELTAAHAALGEDFVFSAVGANLIVTISGLKAGEYTFTGFAHDVTVDQGTIDVSIDTDGAAGAAAALVLDDKAYTTGSGAQVPASYGFDFTADGTNDVVITLDGTNATVLNGFKIAIKMPTPTALPLGYIALCVVVARRF